MSRGREDVRVADRRVLIYGPPLAGKSTALRMLADRCNARVEVFRADAGADGVWNRGLCSELSDDLVVETLGGAVWNEESAWEPLLARSTEVLVTLDLQPSRFEVSMERLGAVCETRAPELVLITKSDLVSTADAISRVRGVLSICGVSTVVLTCSFATGDGVDSFVESVTRPRFV